MMFRAALQQQYNQQQQYGQQQQQSGGGQQYRGYSQQGAVVGVVFRPPPPGCRNSYTSQSVRNAQVGDRGQWPRGDNGREGTMGVRMFTYALRYTEDHVGKPVR
jgi:hypothetical protein